MADVTIGAKLELDAGGGIKTVKDLKNEIKGAKDELILMSEQFGENSKQAQNAAKKVAELNDKLGDANNLVDAFNPDQKFKAFAQSLGGVLGGLTAVQGMMGLIGVESEDLQKQLLKVQSALALSQGLNQLGDSIASMKTFGSIMVQTLGKGGLIGIAAAGVGLLIAQFSGLFDKINSVNEAQKALKDTTKDYAQAAAGAIQRVTEVRVAFDQAKAGVISKERALKIYNDTLGDSLGKTNSLATAENNLTQKADEYIRITGLKAQANALFAKSAEASANVLVITQQLERDIAKGLPEDLATKVRAQLDQMKKDAKEIEDLGASLLLKAQTSANNSGINLFGGTGGGRINKAQDPEELKTAFKKEHIATRAELDKEEAARVAAQNAADLAKTASHYGALTGLFKGFTGNSASIDIQRTNDERAQSIARRGISEEEKEHRRAVAQEVANTLNALAELAGTQTAAGKVLAIAGATINTYLGASKALATGGVIGILQAVAVTAAGLKMVKNIASVKVPGKGGGIPDVSPVSAPLRPQLPGATQTTLNQQQLNQIGNATVRAFVVESDMTTNQQRIRQLNRAARI